MPGNFTVTDEGSLQMYRLPFRVYNSLTGPDVRRMSWPYNLLAIINAPQDGAAQPIDFSISAEHEADIEAIIKEFLPPRWASGVLGYLKEHKSMHKLSRENHVSAEQVRQDLKKGLGILYHQPALRARLLYGQEVAKQLDAVQRALTELEEREKAAKLRDEALTKYEQELDEREQSLKERAATIRERWTTDRTPWVALPGLPKVLTCEEVLALEIGKLNLSLRAFDCLGKAGCRTLNDIIEMARRGKLPELRNLGTITAKEILTKILLLTGEDLFSKNAVEKPDYL